jgi:hypothetical protein
MNNLGHPPKLLFELGRLQVFHFPTPEEELAGGLPKAVFWQDIVAKNTYGPFNSIHAAMTHYTWVVSNQKKQEADKLKPDAQIIYVDFVNKSRIRYEVP